MRGLDDLQYVREVLAYMRFGLWWIGLGVASSIGFGTVLFSPWTSFSSHEFCNLFAALDRDIVEYHQFVSILCHLVELSVNNLKGALLHWWSSEIFQIVICRL